MPPDKIDSAPHIQRIAVWQCDLCKCIGWCYCFHDDGDPICDECGWPGFDCHCDDEECDA